MAGFHRDRPPRGCKAAVRKLPAECQAYSLEPLHSTREHRLLAPGCCPVTWQKRSSSGSPQRPPPVRTYKLLGRCPSGTVLPRWLSTSPQILEVGRPTWILDCNNWSSYQFGANSFLCLSLKMSFLMSPLGLQPHQFPTSCGF